MAREHFVIIGNGPAGNAAAFTLRERVPGSRITILSREAVGEYRPKMLPEYIAGRVLDSDLFVRPHSVYKECDIKLRLGQEVVEADFSARQIILHHNEVVSFDGLIIATGGKPRVPEPLLACRGHMLTLKTLADAKLWRTRLADARSVLIIGGDLTSLSLTKSLATMGKEVSFILDPDSFWPVRFDSDVHNEVSLRLRQIGVKVLEDRHVLKVSCSSENVLMVETDRGAIEAQAVGAFYGLVPDVKFLSRSGLHIERGILVDEYLETRFSGVYAAGDCAQVYHPELRDYWVSIGSHNAAMLGRTAAINLVGGGIPTRTDAHSLFAVEGIKVNTSWWTEF
ncbi:MAG: FAD/NAD(P)-binding oxidoreductase [Pseudomonadota bacterium]